MIVRLTRRLRSSAMLYHLECVTMLTLQPAATCIKTLITRTASVPNTLLVLLPGARDYPLLSQSGHARESKTSPSIDTRKMTKYLHRPIH